MRGIIQMKAIVTGAAGFIGSRLCRRLLHEGMTVTGVDSWTDYYDPLLKKRRIRELAARPGFTFIEQCLTEELSGQALDGTEYLFHLAGQPGVRSCWGESFGEYTRCNITATQRLLETIASRSLPLKKAVYASTSSVYGDYVGGPVGEEALPAPMSPYAVTKLAGEHLFRLYGGQFGIPSVILRYFSVYGPDQRPDMAFQKLCASLHSGDSFTLFGGGEQSRDFTFVDDIVEGTLLAALWGRNGEIYNLGSGRGITMKRAAACLEELTGRKLNMRIEEPLQAGEMKHTLADIAKAGRELGYKPQTTLEEGLARQWEAYRLMHEYAF
jgi:nucleoside-diphosphate-sugar epimerase